MGNICEACDRFSLIENEKIHSKKHEYKVPDIDLPKENISEYSKEEEIEEKKKLKFEVDGTDKVKEKDSETPINNIKIAKDKKSEEKKKKCPKSKTNLIKNKSSSSKSLIEDRRRGRFERRGIRSQSLTKTNQSKLLQDIFYEKTLSKNNISHSQNSKKVFKRKNKKSTTLMENSKVIKQLFDIQLSIPVSQNLLIMEQKGNPSDKYVKGEKIGSGSFGTVYEAKNLIFNNTVAMKVITKSDGMDSEYIKNELDILKKLSHPNIVRIYEFYESENDYYLINEFCNGGELYNYINKTKLNEQQLSIIFYQVFSGLCYLHENDVLYRDMKPENILISKKEIDLLTNEEYFWIQIIDFDCAKIFEQNKKDNIIVGSIYYLAPEVLNREYNEKCDTWSVGVILYMFLVGKPPFNGLNNDEIINSIKTKEYDENNEKLIQASPEVRDLIKGLLNKNTDERFSAKQALNHQWFKKFNGRKLFENFKNEDIQHFIDNLFNYTFHSKIQQLVIAFLVHNLPTSDSSRNILKLYRYFNTSGDCKLTKNELINGLSKYRDEVEVRRKVGTLFLLLDADNNGFIEFEEFLRACIDKKEILTEEYLKYAFKFLDKNDNGSLTVQQICSAFLISGNKMFEIALSKDINDVDEDGDGNINFPEFKKLMTNAIN